MVCDGVIENAASYLLPHSRRRRHRLERQKGTARPAQTPGRHPSRPRVRERARVRLHRRRRVARRTAPRRHSWESACCFQSPSVGA